MKRVMKNGILFAAMLVAVGMLTLTVLHGFGGFANAGDGSKAPMGAGDSLGGHLAFAAVWVFLFAFCLSWAIYSRCNSEYAGRKGGDRQWKSEPASNGTN